MCPHVSGKVTSTTKSFITLCAFIWLLSSVCSHMYSQIARHFECFSTLCTYVNILFSMGLHNCDLVMWLDKLLIHDHISQILILVTIYKKTKNGKNMQLVKICMLWYKYGIGIFTKTEDFFRLFEIKNAHNTQSW